MSPATAVGGPFFIVRLYVWEVDGLRKLNYLRTGLLCVVAIVLVVAAPMVAQAGVKHQIRKAWGPNWRERQAIRVAACESGFNTRAVNGQYLGIFQMGATERATYGHGPSARKQARAAHRYFVASGRDWSPWACKP